MSRFPAVFVNHGGGPMPLLGAQPDIVNHMKDIVKSHIPRDPKAIVVLSAHWETSPIKITSSAKPDMLFDYYGFPPKTYEYKYPAPGHPELAERIHQMMKNAGIKSELDPKRGYDHGVFVPLMIMYPKADIPVVAISLDASLDPRKNIDIGAVLEPLRDEDVLILGSGLSYHNMGAFSSPSHKAYASSAQFNDWLINAITKSSKQDEMLQELAHWEEAPGAREAHPREEHLLPLLMVAATGSEKGKLVFNSLDIKDRTSKFAISGFVF